jgi:diacylglycerol kinase (ATP)
VERVHLLSNERAGGGGADVERVLAGIRRHGIEPVVLRPANTHDVGAVLDHALDDGMTRLVVAGGDGTVHVAVGALAARGADVTIGIVPVGTGNDIARGFGLPLNDLDAAVSAALAPAGRVDLIDTGHAPIVSVATLGFSVDVNERANRLRWPKGSSRYNIATLLELPGLATRPIRLTVDGVAHHINVTLLAIGNTTAFGGGMLICPAADPTDGLLDVTVIGPIARLELLRVFPSVFKGTHLDHHAVSTYRGATISVEHVDPNLRPECWIWGDGEPVTALPISLTARAASMRVAGRRSEGDVPNPAHPYA